MTVTIEHTFTQGESDPATRQFSFPYLDQTDIKVTFGGNAETDWRLVNATTIEFVDDITLTNPTAQAPPTGTVIRIYRDTAFETPKATFYPGSAIRAGDLNDNTLQNLYVTQEGNAGVLNAWKKGDPTIISTETWASTDTQIGTTKAIDGQIDAKITAFRTTNVDITGNITVSGTVDGRDLAADGTKLDGIATSANNYVHPNHSGEVTSTADGATVVTDAVIDLANLKVSNTGTNGQYLQKSGTTEGLTWASGTSVGGSSGLDFNDSVKARFGTDNDLEIYSTGSDAYIDNTTGNLYLYTTTGNSITIGKTGEISIKALPDNRVELYYDNVKKFETSSTGTTVTGTAVADGFTGPLTGDVTGDVTGNVTGSSGSCTGNAATATTATNANHISVADNENTNENNLIPFIEDASATGNVGLESDGDFHYNPSTGVVTATAFTGNLTGNVTGNTSGTAATVTGAAQTNITSVGTLTSLTVGTGDLIVDTDTLLVDSSEDKVGINKTPTASLDVSGNVIQTSTAVASTVIDCSLGNYFTKAINDNIAFTFSNVPTSGNAYGCILELDVTGDRTIGWPAAVKWVGGSAPSYTAGKTHLFSLVTVDNGTTWRGSAAVDYTT